jgi:CRP/FNR family cyclic AMP-dependent transcriptional regulator
VTDLHLAKRKFLIASADADDQQALADWVGDHVDRASCFFAADGHMALQKIENDPPHVLIIREDLPKSAGHEVVRTLLIQDQKPLSVILLGEIPESEEFAEVAALGQLQFLAPDVAKEKIGACLVRALNFLSRGDHVDFSLRFLTAGDYLMRRGEKAETVYILKRGSMKAVVNESATEANQIVLHEVVLGQISEKEFVGEMAYINGDVRSADVVAQTDCELIEIPILHLDRLLFQKPAWAMALMKTLSKRMKVANQRIAQDG